MLKPETLESSVRSAGLRPGGMRSAELRFGMFRSGSPGWWSADFPIGIFPEFPGVPSMSRLVDVVNETRRTGVRRSGAAGSETGAPGA